jgi:hypothetical protein
MSNRRASTAANGANRQSSECWRKWEAPSAAQSICGALAMASAGPANAAESIRQNVPVCRSGWVRAMGMRVS